MCEIRCSAENGATACSVRKKGQPRTGSKISRTRPHEVRRYRDTRTWLLIFETTRCGRGRRSRFWPDEFLWRELRPGFDVVAEAVELEAKIRNADLVITGEGKLDRQTLEGKTPAGVARFARKVGKRVFAIVGRAINDREVHEIFDDVYENARPGMSEKENMKRAAELLRDNARELARSL